MVRMIRTARGTPTGRNPAFWYRAGETYGSGSDPPMSERLAESFVRGGLAERVNHKTQPADYERKVTEPRTDTASVDTSTMTVQEVLAAVRSGHLSRGDALAAERAGKARSTLLSALSE